ncbi:alcohol dehydrogenase catalytic domain-containing protein [Glaciibacter superstes]|uniref:alcohol dehydrogenase catalytic domain-containing protein n=1 Tax=Glaciibacter superstes TaxID=501023 RepID=UPI001FDFFFDF|nr:alcohol dehydrogenase catalytic domain-containing protein [Glaciibacter superstes]
MRRTCGVCQWCPEGKENLCPDSHYTGWNIDGGGYTPSRQRFPRRSPTRYPPMSTPARCATGDMR